MCRIVLGIAKFYAETTGNEIKFSEEDGLRMVDIATTEDEDNLLTDWLD